MEVKLSLIANSIAIAVFLTVAAKLLNWVWFMPRRLEKLLRAQGLKGNSYRTFIGDAKDEIASTKQRPRSIHVSQDIIPHILPYYHQTLSTYGENSFVWLGPWPRLMVTNGEMVKELFKRGDAFHKPFPEMIKNLTGGLTIWEGDKWAKHRKIMNPAFHMDKLKNMVPVMGQCCWEMIKKWKGVVGGAEYEIDVWAHLEDLTADVISRTAFGTTYEEGKAIFELHREKLKLALKLAKFSFIPGWRYIPTKGNRRVKAMSREIRSMVRNMIDKGKHNDDTVLGIIMDSNSRYIQQHNTGLSLEDVIDECTTLYAVGSETTASLLVWTMVLLSQFPQWQTLAREEVLQVFEDSQPITFQGLNNLKTVTMILQETLRLYPPVPQVTRCSMKTTNLGKLTLPAGVHFSLLIGCVHSDLEIWGEDAKEFKPERFSKGASGYTSFVPFGWGPRTCIGQHFAMLEAKIALAMILKHFSFRLSPSYLHSPMQMLTMTPQYGAPLILQHLNT